MSDESSAIQEKLRVELLNLLYAIIERELSRPPYATLRTTSPHCPRCGSEHTAKRGHDDAGRQRRLCNACSRSFTAATGSALSSTNIPLETWLVFADCCAEKQTLRETAEQCNVCLKTAFYMRKRLDTAVKKYAMQVKQCLQSYNNGNARRTR